MLQLPHVGMGRLAAVTGVPDLLAAYMVFQAGMTIKMCDGMYGASAGTALTGPLLRPTPVPVPVCSVLLGWGDLLHGGSENGQKWQARWCVHQGLQNNDSDKGPFRQQWHLARSNMLCSSVFPR